ncbi:cation-translocating P-type ATPase [Trebonia kvetii]|uniref:cation-translocating P-type ATPase n=1 Tax=Trebonia kvetii TaxID=2480626 RepID=UPI001C9E565A|nr:HAD-IC family P-type ATPase [Trebonia kvetii]
MPTRLTDEPGLGRRERARGTEWHTLSAGQALQDQVVTAEHGLSSAEVASRSAQFGPNAVGAGKAEPRWRAFLRQYSDPMQLVLLAAGVLSFPLKQAGTGLLLILLTLANAVLGLQQEGQAETAVSALEKKMIILARVRRDGRIEEIPAEQLVPGDIVSIEAGDIVPADGRLLHAAMLEVAESELTGESTPVSKCTAAVGEPSVPLGDRTCMVYMNTPVTRGAGEFVVTATGMETEIGHVSGMLQAQPVVKTPLTRQLDHLSKQLLLVSGTALIASMAVNLARGYTFHAVFNAAVAFAIAAVPVQLPTVVTTILAWGTRALASGGAIMKKLTSTETLGAVSAINTDKTGTLTLNQMTAVRMTVGRHRYAVEGRGYSTDGRINRVAGQAEVPLDQVLTPMVLASDAVLSDGELIGDPTEGALVALAAKGGIDAVSTRREYPRVAELPFDATYKLMATFHEMTDESGRQVVRCFVKGAPDRLLARAGAVLDPDAGPVRLDDARRELYQADNRHFAEEGLRVMAVARRDLDPAGFDPGSDLLALVTELELLALVGIMDPPRPGAAASVAQAKSAGVEVRMITGDHAVTAAAIAGQLGIDGAVITGAELEAMSDDAAMTAIAGAGVVARVTPEHKVRLVDMLKRRGQIVAMTGDGVNDAPALKQADIGIAMGTGTEVAKRAAVMVLTDDNFATIIKAVELGRGLYDNLVRYIRFEMGCMFGFILTFLGASIFNIARGEPLLPLQVLWVAFTTVTIQSIGLGYSSPAEGLMERSPRAPGVPILSRWVLGWLVVIGTVMAVGTLGVIHWAEHAHGLLVARTMGMVVFSLFNLFFSIESRDSRESAFSLRTFSDRTFMATTGLSFLLIVLATFIQPCQAILRTRALDERQWLLCLVVALSIVAVCEIRKALPWRNAD